MTFLIVFESFLILSGAAQGHFLDYLWIKWDYFGGDFGVISDHFFGSVWVTLGSPWDRLASFWGPFLALFGGYFSVFFSRFLSDILRC